MNRFKIGNERRLPDLPQEHKQRREEIELLQLLDKCTHILRDDRIWLRAKLKESDSEVLAIFRKVRRTSHARVNANDLHQLEVQLRKHVAKHKSTIKQALIKEHLAEEMKEKGVSMHRERTDRQLGDCRRSVLLQTKPELFPKHKDETEQEQATKNPCRKSRTMTRSHSQSTKTFGCTQKPQQKTGAQNIQSKHVKKSSQIVKSNSQRSITPLRQINQNTNKRNSIENCSKLKAMTPQDYPLRTSLSSFNLNAKGDIRPNTQRVSALGSSLYYRQSINVAQFGKIQNQNNLFSCRSSENLWKSSESITSPYDYNLPYKYPLESGYSTYRPSSPEYNFMAASLSPSRWQIDPPGNEKLFTPPALLMECRMIVEQSKRRRGGLSSFADFNCYAPTQSKYQTSNQYSSYMNQTTIPSPSFPSATLVANPFREQAAPRTQAPGTTISGISQCTFSSTQIVIPTTSDLPDLPTEKTESLPHVDQVQTQVEEVSFGNMSEVPEVEEKSSVTEIVTELSAEEVFEMFFSKGNRITMEEYYAVVDTFKNQAMKDKFMRFVWKDDTICPLKFGKFLREFLKQQQPASRVRQIFNIIDIHRRGKFTLEEYQQFLAQLIQLEAQWPRKKIPNLTSTTYKLFQLASLSTPAVQYWGLYLTKNTAEFRTFDEYLQHFEFEVE